jgi:hypothetical protein
MKLKLFNAFFSSSAFSVVSIAAAGCGIRRYLRICENIADSVLVLRGRTNLGG